MFGRIDAGHCPRTTNADVLACVCTMWTRRISQRWSRFFMDDGFPTGPALPVNQATVRQSGVQSQALSETPGARCTGPALSPAGERFAHPIDIHRPES